MFLGQDYALSILSGNVQERVAQSRRIGWFVFGLLLIFSIAGIGLLRSAFLPKPEDHLHLYDRVLRLIGAMILLIPPTVGIIMVILECRS